VLVAPRTVLIAEAIQVVTPINSVIIKLSNIINPAPAKTTGNFMAKIGIDLS